LWAAPLITVLQLPAPGLEWNILNAGASHNKGLNGTRKTLMEHL
jgi:hypothetical protein